MTFSVRRSLRGKCCLRGVECGEFGDEGVVAQEERVEEGDEEAEKTHNF